MRLPIALTGAFLLYSIGMLLWFVFVTQVAQLEADVGPRFVRLSGWPYRLTLLGLGWTVLLVLAVTMAVRAANRATAPCVAATSAATVAVSVLLPVLFRDMGYIGPSTSEFLDATFLLLGGALPGGQATLGLALTSAVLIVLTLVVGVRAARV